MSEQQQSLRQKLETWRSRFLWLKAKYIAFENVATRLLSPIEIWLFKKIKSLLRWCRKHSNARGIAKLAAICATIGGTATALGPVSASGSVSTGLAITAAGAGSYAVIKGIPVKGYEITKHVPPRSLEKPPVNMYKPNFSSIRSGGKK